MRQAPQEAQDPDPGRPWRSLDLGIPNTTLYAAPLEPERGQIRRQFLVSAGDWGFHVMVLVLDPGPGPRIPTEEELMPVLRSLAEQAIAAGE